MLLSRAVRQGFLASQSLLSHTAVSTTTRFAKTFTLPSTEDVGDPTPFWERKIYQRFDRMDFNKDGFICYKDFDAQMKYMLVSHKHTDETMAKITNLFEVAWERIWSFGIRQKDKRVSKKAFLFGYTRLIQRAPRRLELSSTLEELLGGCFDIFDEAQHGQRTGKMTKEDFIAYQMCWNLTDAEAEQLFHEITGHPGFTGGTSSSSKKVPDAPATHITRDQYLLAAWDFYFRMQETKSIGKNFFGALRKKKIHLHV